jgi:hypothetical protein
MASRPGLWTSASSGSLRGRSWTATSAAAKTMMPVEMRKDSQLGAADEGHGQAGAIVPGARPGLAGKETLAGSDRVTVLSRVLAAGARH